MPDFSKATIAGKDISTRYMASGFRRIVAFGHSLMGGGGAWDSTYQGFGHVLAGMLGAEFHNYARGGAVAAEQEQTGSNLPGGPGQNGSGGWAYVIGGLSIPIQTNAQFPQGAASWIYPEPHPANAQQPYVPPPWLPLLYYGGNDLGFLQYSGGSANATRNLNAFLDAMRTIISRMTAAAIYEENDPSVGFNNVFGTTAAQGSWAASNGQGYGLGSGNDVRAIPNVLTSGTGGITINVPADFEAGDVIALGFLLTAGASGQVTVAVNGTSAGLPNGGVINFANRTAIPKVLVEQPLGIVYRITGLAAGTHTITINVTGTPVVNAWFDYWQVEAGAVKAPVSAIIPSLHKPISYTIWPAPYPTDADVDTWNAAYSSMIASEFPGCLWVDMNNVLSRTATPQGTYPDFYYDQVHPSDLGHQKIAAKIFDSLNAVAPLQTAAGIATQARERPREKISMWTLPGGATIPNVTWTFFNSSLPSLVMGSPAIPPEVVIPASVGDIIEVGAGGWTWDNSSSVAYGYGDVAVMGSYAAPTGLTATLVAGTWTPTAAGTFYYWISCMNANGETVASGPLPVTVAANQNVQLSFWTPGGITHVRIYRTTGSGYPSSGANRVADLTGLASSQTNTWTDTGLAATASTWPPAVNQAYGTPIRYLSNAGNGLWPAITPAVGSTGMYMSATSGGPFHFQVQPGDSQPAAGTGSIILRLAFRVNAGSRGLVGGSGNTASFYAKNLGRQTGFLDRVT